MTLVIVITRGLTIVKVHLVKTHHIVVMSVITRQEGDGVDPRRETVVTVIDTTMVMDHLTTIQTDRHMVPHTEEEKVMGPEEGPKMVTKNQTVGLVQ